MGQHQLHSGVQVTGCHALAHLVQVLLHLALMWLWKHYDGTSTMLRCKSGDDMHWRHWPRIILRTNLRLQMGMVLVFFASNAAIQATCGGPAGVGCALHRGNWSLNTPKQLQMQMTFTCGTNGMIMFYMGVLCISTISGP